MTTDWLDKELADDERRSKEWADSLTREELERFTANIRRMLDEIAKGQQEPQKKP